MAPNRAVVLDDLTNKWFEKDCGEPVIGDVATLGALNTIISKNSNAQFKPCAMLYCGVMSIRNCP